MSEDFSEHVLARSIDLDDERFGSLEALARRIVALRDALAGKPELTCIDAQLWRGDMPGAHVVAVRALDGARPKGSLIGYAFLPSKDGKRAFALLGAIVALTPADA